MKRILYILAFVMIFSCLLSSCGTNGGKSDSSSGAAAVASGPEYTEYSDLRGKTMMIVTHEMSFARAICNRVFFLNQGGIYEDGTPEQIFDNPQKDLTRRFIHRLKVMELFIDNPDYDFIGAGSEIDQYCMRSDISPRVKYRIRLTFEELTQQMLFPVLSRTPIQVTVEYSEAEEKAIVNACYGGGRFDPAEGENSLSYKVLKGSVEELSYTYNENEELSNTVRVVICEKQK